MTPRPPGRLFDELPAAPRERALEVKQKIGGRCFILFMHVLLELLRERYSELAFTLKKGELLWELGCFEGHRELWRLRGEKTEIEGEMRYLLDAAKGPVLFV